MSSASRNSLRSNQTELRMRMLEAQAELKRAEVAKQLEEEELALQAKILASKRKSYEELTALKLNCDKLQLEYEVRSEVEGTRSSSTPSEACAMKDPAPQLPHEDVEERRDDVNIHYEDGTINRAHETDISPPKVRNVTYDLRAPTYHSTPLDPASTPFVPKRTTVTHDSTPEDAMLQTSQLVKALDCTLASQQELARRTQLPPMKLERFNGDLTKFSLFKNSFVWIVENNTDDPTRRLTHLYNCLDGTPKNLIENCFHLPPAVGYQRAWEILTKKYRNDNDLSDAFVQRLFDWKEIAAGDCDGLENYAAYLSNVMAALGQNYVRVELQETMKKIVEKLPYQLRIKWIARCEEHDFKLPALIEYIEKQARIAKHLHYYECDRRAKKPSDKLTMPASTKPTSTKPLPVHHTSSPNKGKWCPHCSKNGHDLPKCFRFEKLKLSERWESVRKSRYCFRCLKAPHTFEECPESSACGKCGVQSHHTLLHGSSKTATESSGSRSEATGATGGGDKAVPPTTATTTPEGAEGSSETSKAQPMHSVNTGAAPDGRIMLKILPVLVNGTHVAYGFIDGGAAPTLVAKSLVERLGLKGRPCHQTMVTEAGTFTCKEVLPLHIGSMSTDDGDQVEDVFVADKINVSTEYIMPPEWLHKWSHLSDLEVPSLLPENHEVELIIGLGTTVNRVILDQRHGERDEPSAYLTKLGWVVFGPTGPKPTQRSSPLHHVCPVENTTELLQRNFNQDFWEKGALSKIENSLEDEKFLTVMEETVCQKDGKYVASLPFKDSTPLPNNRAMAERRALSLKRKLDSDEAYKEAYSEQVEKCFLKGYAEVVPMEQLDRSDGRVNYMAHHGVKHPTKDKLRVVYDLKAKYAGTSLNDHLMQGPDLTSSLAGVLLRFREGQHAVTADIQEMFHQVKVLADDRDSLRFLWWPGGDTTQQLVEYRMTSHVFGARSSPSVVNYCLRQTALDHGAKYNEEASLALQRNFYVDNLLKSMDSEEECIRLSEDLIGLCADGGFRLNQWTSSSKRVLAAVPEEERDTSVAALDLSKDELPTERALGIHWAMNSDAFTFKINLKDKPRTRRGVLSIVASLYDPLGFVAPYTLQGKMLLQDLCRRDLSWDEEMNEDEISRWNKWTSQLQQLEGLQIKRSFVPADFGEVASYQLHHFADASQSGYGVSTYLRVEGKAGRVHCTLVMGRARVAPLRRPSIPRMELTAAAVAAQLDSKLKSELDLVLMDSVFWTDSTSVLKYIKNQTARYHTFVNNRVNLIRDLSDATAWRYVGTAENPADLASRGLCVENLLKSSLWFSGPTFLSQGREC